MDLLLWSLWVKLYLYAAAKSLQSCRDPIDGCPPGSPVPGILQARTLEWVAISFSSAWRWKVKVKSPSRVRPSATPWTAALQALPSMGFSRQEYWSGVPSPSPVLFYKCIYHCTCFWKFSVFPSCVQIIYAPSPTPNPHPTSLLFCCSSGLTPWEKHLAAVSASLPSALQCLSLSVALSSVDPSSFRHFL